ncbi:MAG: hypothetical protein E6I92_06675 [Chloroflexi bacterium]|nr:MAG: hypothetical protein E6I92_06675 [Chloroflexota bacterium]
MGSSGEDLAPQRAPPTLPHPGLDQTWGRRVEELAQAVRLALARPGGDDPRAGDDHPRGDRRRLPPRARARPVPESRDEGRGEPRPPRPRVRPRAGGEGAGHLRPPGAQQGALGDPGRRQRRHRTGLRASLRHRPGARPSRGDDRGLHQLRQARPGDRADPLRRRHDRRARRPAARHAAPGHGVLARPLDRQAVHGQRHLVRERARHDRDGRDRLRRSGEHREDACGDQPDQRQQPPALRRPHARGAARVLGGVMAGAMSPMGLAGTVAQQTAEALAGMALVQLIRPGTPSVYGSFLTNTDMQSGSPAFGTPESAMGILASAQMARRYHLPFRGGGALTSSKSPDAQAAYESMMCMWPTILGRVNFVLHAAGWLESALLASYEKFVIDVEQLRMFEWILGHGMPVDDEGLAMDALREVGPGGHFLGAEHTMRHYRTGFYRPWVSSTENFDRWQRFGSRTADVVAAERWKQLLAEYADPGIDPGVDEQLKASIPESTSS